MEGSEEQGRKGENKLHRRHSDYHWVEVRKRAEKMEKREEM
jgi:hypothetical protein